MIRFYPDDKWVTALPNNLLFVFGSNLAGIHGKGAAKVARANFGARLGQGAGLAGQSYAIPTKDARLRVLPLRDIEPYVSEFVALTQTRDDVYYFVTAVGCGEAGYRAADIAPLFSGCQHCYFPQAWEPFINARPPVITGIGSRKTPPEMLHAMEELSALFVTLGYKLRSGAADGADTAFERGFLKAQGETEIWLPWQRFNHHAHSSFLPRHNHFMMASLVHPAYPYLKPSVQALHARNVGQVLGDYLDEPAALVVCWTPDGCETGATRTKETGGTGTAIAVASLFNVPVFNLKNADALARISNFLKRNTHGAQTALDRS